MSISTVKNNMSVIIGKSIARTATVQYTDPNAASYLADGEVLIVNETGAIMTDASTVGTAPRFRVVQRSGNRLIYSPVIAGQNVKAYKGIDGSSGSDQVTTIGYNGTSGSIDVSGTDDFVMNLQLGFDESMWSEQSNNYPFIVPNSGTVNQMYVAESLARQINYQFTNGGNFSVAGEGPIVKATLVSADAGAAIGAAADTVIGFAGSKTVTITDTGADSSITTAIVAGDYVRFGTATTAPVYKVASSTVTTAGGVLTLTMPLQANVSLLGTTSELITAAQAAAAAAGVVITGQALKFTKDFYKYLQVTFKVLIKNASFGATTLATTAAVRPVGSGTQVSEMESFAEGFRGILNRTIIPLPTPKSDADTSVNYDMIYISWEDTTDTSPVDGTKPARSELYICMVDGASQTSTATNGVLTVLNAYMLTTPGRFANVAL